MIKQNIVKLVNKIKNKSFPELKGKKILVIEFPNILPIAESTSIKYIKNYYIFINKKCEKRNVLALKGQIAHELSHITLNYLNKNIISSVLHFCIKTISAIFNTKFSREIETKTDKLTIKRGFAKERYALALDWKNIYSKETLEKTFYTRGYLKPKEIKKYAREIRKW